MSTSKTLYTRPDTLTDKSTHYCPGCTHGIIHKLIAQIIDEFNIAEKTTCIAPVGCAVLLYEYINVDSIEAAHGRAPAIATGLKRVKPDHIVISYQGDGDLLSIGMGETIHAANRGENITVIFINNAIYGMTGGQMAPTTVAGQKTATSPLGRDPKTEGYPIGGCELISALQAPYFIERVKTTSSKEIVKAKRILKKAIKYQMEGRGYSFVEILSHCTTGWGVDPLTANDIVNNDMEKIFPIKNFRDMGASS
jgi:2-oxoglutarate ferredoxin oxidoreductase subunit beta